MNVTADMVKELREKTGAGMMDCKKALVETGGDLQKAVDYLRTKGIAKAAAKAGRATEQGLIEAYATGRGRVVIRGKVHQETVSGRESIVMTSPFLRKMREA